MAERLNPEETVTLEELAISNSFEIAAIFNILKRKGLITISELEGVIPTLALKAKN